MNENKLLLGKNAADKIKSDISDKIALLWEKNIQPTLATLRIGEKPDDIAYETSATSVLSKMNIDVKNIRLPYDISQNDLQDLILKLNKDENTNGILLFRPLPEHFDEEYICNLIDIKKDVDCISKASLAEVFDTSQMSKKPCTAQAVIEILKFYNIKTEGKNITVLGRSNVVGKPVSIMLLNENATVTICHSKTKNLQSVCQNADILVCAVGKAKFVNENFVKEGAIVVDVGINDLDGKIVGDVDFDSVLDKVSLITPVPRGVGSVTTAILAQNLLKCMIQQHNYTF